VPRQPFAKEPGIPLEPLPPPGLALGEAERGTSGLDLRRREALQRNARLLRERLARHGISTAPSTTHVVPVRVGDNDRTMAVCEDLLERGFYAQGIRYPSVPASGARLRLTPMATHTETEILTCADAVSEELAAQR